LAIPNITLMEGFWVDSAKPTDVVTPWPKIVDGYAYPPVGPGLGVEFNEEIAASIPQKPTRILPKLNGIDGSVRDW
jgi:L-alanine-DL-glutamate epimerase-like enolase superfamily enzyme